MTWWKKKNLNFYQVSTWDLNLRSGPKSGPNAILWPVAKTPKINFSGWYQLRNVSVCETDLRSQDLISGWYQVSVSALSFIKYLVNRWPELNRFSSVQLTGSLSGSPTHLQEGEPVQWTALLNRLVTLPCPHFFVRILFREGSCLGCLQLLHCSVPFLNSVFMASFQFVLELLLTSRWDFFF